MLNRLIQILLITSIALAQDVIGEGLYSSELISFLRTNYKTNSTLGYTACRDTLYLKVDRIEGQVKGVYTNYAVSLPDNGIDPSSHLYENGIDCEHLWPQSMYQGSDPMKSDMHHLRPCKSNVNSSRGNKPYGENLDSNTDTWFWLNQSQSSIPSSNIDEYSESETMYFEPREDRKGDIARSMFYFYTMYSEVADDNFFAAQKDILKDWHLQDPSNIDEINRTWAIASYQQNKPNPFIIDETLVYRAYFYEGSLVGDLNGDSNIDILDVVYLVNVILNGGQNTPNSDLNNDGDCNILDVVILASIILS